MNRPAIPEELKRAVLVEAGHRCAIHTCRNTEIEIAHIIPWEKCRVHEFENLIALCPNCHTRHHQGRIDRKALRQYKENLASGRYQAEPPPDVTRAYLEAASGVGYDWKGVEWNGLFLAVDGPDTDLGEQEAEFVGMESDAGKALNDAGFSIRSVRQGQIGRAHRQGYNAFVWLTDRRSWKRRLQTGAGQYLMVRKPPTDGG